jgi:4-oxalomesaconate tautomerase
MAKQTAIPCVLMRGGTSKGPYFKMSDLPEDPVVRDRVLLASMGSPDVRQIDGVGGADTLTSKVAMVGPSSGAGCDVDYLFAQVSVDRPIVDTLPPCGNMLSGVGPFAIEAGMVPVEDGETTVTIYNVNTDSRIEAVIRTPEGVVEYEGDCSIDGVPGTGAPILLKFLDVAGSKTGSLLPTGRPKETIDGISVTCMDVAMPMVIMKAADLGKTGYESKAELDSNATMLERLERIRLEAGRRMRLGDVTGKVIPKIGLIAAPRHGGAIASRYFVPHNCHAAHAVTGGICIATCAVMEGTVADGLSDVRKTPVERIIIEHPSGTLEVKLSVKGFDSDLSFVYGGVVRTARRLFEGRILVPSSVWDGKR